MNRFHLPALLIGLGFALHAAHVRAQEPAAEETTDERVQYQLVLPDEKTPETVKPEEHNPFESESEAQGRLAPGDTEENRVRDRLLKLPVVGTKRMADGRMRVLLGNIILETGKPVPPVLPDQQVQLHVKNITTEYIELAWQEKRATGLPPKLMMIQINIAPRVRYQMLGQINENGVPPKGANATMEMPLRDLATQAPAPQPVVSAPPPTEQPAGTESGAEEDVRTAPPAATEKMAAAEEPPPPAASPPASPPPSSPAVESVVRMLFGNPTPAPK